MNTHGLVEVITTAYKSREATKSWSYADFQDLRNADTGISIFAWSTAPGEVRRPGGLKMTLRPMYVSADYFETIGVRLPRGPGFEGKTDAAVILGYHVWQNHLSSDPDIIGRTLRLDNVPYVVAGIAADQFQGHLGLPARNGCTSMADLRTGLLSRRRARRLPSPHRKSSKHTAATNELEAGDGARDHLRQSRTAWFLGLGYLTSRRSDPLICTRSAASSRYSILRATATTSPVRVNSPSIRARTTWG